MQKVFMLKMFCSPHDNRQFTPVQSDTEFETKRGLSEVEDCKAGEQAHQKSWRWGELPTAFIEEASKEEGNLSTLCGYINLLK